ncbi:hypothetical protein [Streptomyces bluensis]|uniref:GyrI-like small molecule binding domain-containing protein n=1 Tax=Streptomyces bluensis TaxID=33897 RepID=A0ABW6UGV0_9ACTN|nr:hypothetical protein [Streptomyces bluensis]GGZ40785.1 hypothetical protein GCM10010344_01690 [Streptomyces bluensis]
MLNPDFCLDVPDGFDDSEAETGVHPVARKLFLGSSPAQVFSKAHTWVSEHDVHIQGLSWDFLDGEGEPHCLSMYFTFELRPAEG